MLENETAGYSYPYGENSLLMGVLKAVIAIAALFYAVLLSVSFANAEPFGRQASVRLPGTNVAEGIVRVVQCQHEKIVKTLRGESAAPLLVSGNIGMLMDDADRICVKQILNYVADGLAAVWDNRASKIRYLLTPLHSTAPDGEDLCRVYTAQAFAHGTVMETYQKACRRNDGTWRVRWGEPFDDDADGREKNAGATDGAQSNRKEMY
ncbi:MAG: hypothetical protein RIB59_01995 [Rhodospirillales bacterium]